MRKKTYPAVAIVIVALVAVILLVVFARGKRDVGMVMAEGSITFGDYDGFEVQLVMTEGTHYSEDEAAPSIYVYEDNYEGEYVLRLLDGRGKIADEISLNKSCGRNSINFPGIFDISVGDYNGDGLADFTIGNAESSPMNVFWIFSVGEDGRLAYAGEFVDVSKEFSILPTFCEDGSFYSTIWNNADGVEEQAYYTWDADTKTYKKIK